MLITAPWPDFQRDAIDPAASAEMEWVVQAISAIRALRAEMNVPPAARVPLLIKDAEPVAAQRIERHREHFVRLARVERFEPVETVPPGGVQAVVEGATLILASRRGGRSRTRKGAARQGDRQARRRAGQDCRQARQPQFPRQGQARGGRGAARARGGREPRPRSPEGGYDRLAAV